MISGPTGTLACPHCARETGCAHDAAWAAREWRDGMAAAAVSRSRAERLRAMSAELGTWGREAQMGEVRSVLEREARAWEDSAEETERWAADCHEWAVWKGVAK